MITTRKPTFDREECYGKRAEWENYNLAAGHLNRLCDVELYDGVILTACWPYQGKFHGAMERT